LIRAFVYYSSIKVLNHGGAVAESLYKTPHKFNGKGLDAETGLYYYGARYYDPKISLWLGVDPLMENIRAESL